MAIYKSFPVYIWLTDLEKWAPFEVAVNYGRHAWPSRSWRLF